MARRPTPVLFSPPAQNMSVHDGCLAMLLFRNQTPSSSIGILHHVLGMGEGIHTEVHVSYTQIEWGGRWGQVGLLLLKHPEHHSWSVRVITSHRRRYYQTFFLGHIKRKHVAYRRAFDFIHYLLRYTMRTPRYFRFHIQVLPFVFEDIEAHSNEHFQEFQDQLTEWGDVHSAAYRLRERGLLFSEEDVPLVNFLIPFLKINQLTQEELDQHLAHRTERIMHRGD